MRNNEIQKAPKTNSKTDVKFGMNAQSQKANSKMAKLKLDDTN